MMQSGHARELASGDRFAFGANWQAFLSVLDEERVREAERALTTMLGRPSLAGLSFLDVGSGSGLSSLAARRLGARVRSFDYDPQSVACTAELKRRYFDGDPAWTVEEGSVLDHSFVEGLGQFDVVYSWGVLHHTGDLQAAMENVVLPVKPGGLLFIALYNDQGGLSAMWKRVKRLYCSGPAGRALVTAIFVPYFALGYAYGGWAQHRDPSWFFRNYAKQRGMSIRHDWIDWLGGLPFEVASPTQVFRFYRDRGFELVEMITAGGGSGCNEYVFRRRTGA